MRRKHAATSHRYTAGQAREIVAESRGFLRSVPVRALLRFFPLLLLSLAVAPAPAGVESRGCISVPILDPDIRASFARFDATQSPPAARLCAVFFNNAALPGHPR